MNRKKMLLFFLFILLSITVFFCFFRKNNDIDHIFLVTIDTLRADHLGSYGYPMNTTPFIDSIAKKGILFEKAFSQSATTLPSHASIFTGLYPAEHKVIANGYVLDDSYVTLPEILKKKGDIKPLHLLPRIFIFLIQIWIRVLINMKNHNKLKKILIFPTGPVSLLSEKLQNG